MSKLRIFIYMLLCLALLSGSLTAQELKGQIFGTVSDDEGIALPGVIVEATSPKMIGIAATATNEFGAYRLLALVPGTYKIVFSVPGFNTIIREGIIVVLEKTITVNVTMEPGAIEEKITIIGRSPLIDVKSQARGMVLTKEVFQLLPRGRNFDSLITTIPGVINEDDLLDGPSVDGASGAENMFFVDGMSTSDLVDGVSGQQVSFDFAEEVQVKSSGYNAEYGGSLGGVINVITRSGGNEFHGELIGYYWGSALEGKRRDVLDYDADTDEARYYDYDEYYGVTDDYTIEGGLNLGGYVFKDRLWFFVSAMPKYFKRTRTADFNVVGKDVVKEFTRKRYWYNYSAKLTAQPLKNLRVGAGFVNNYYKYKGNNVEARHSSSTADHDAYGFSYPNYSISGYADLTLGNNALFSVRGGFWTSDTKDQLVEPQTLPRWQFYMDQPYNYMDSTNDIPEWPEIPEEYRHAKGWTSYPSAGLYETLANINERISVNADFTYFADFGGEHAFKGGVQFVRQKQDVNDGAVVPRVYLAWDSTFTAYGTEYGRGTYGWYSVRGNDVTGPYGDFYLATANRWAIYLQDTWTIQEKLTLNIGIRTESEYLPNYSDDPDFADVTKPVDFPFSDKIAPRFGFVYDVYGDSSLKVFGNFAIYQDVMKLYMAANAFGGFKWTSAYYSLDDWDYEQIGVNNNYPGTFYTSFNHRPPAFDDVEPGMKPFSQREISLGGEKLLGENMALSVRVVNKSVLYAIEDAGLLLPTPEGGVNELYLFCNPGFSWINGKYDESIAAGHLETDTPYLPKAKRLYWAVNAALDKRFSDNWLGGISLTWSRLTGNYSGLANSDEYGRNDPNGERCFDLWHLMVDKNLDPLDGPLPTDRPIVLKAYGSYVFDFGLTVGGIVNAMSGTPVTEDWNVDSTGYFPYNRGNLGRTPFLWFTNLYVEYNLNLGGAKIQLSANVDNVFNVSTSRRVWTEKFIDNVSPGDRALLDKDWDIPADVELDSLFEKEFSFYPPIEVRLGIKFIF